MDGIDVTGSTVKVYGINAGSLWWPYREVFQDSLQLPPEHGSTIPVFCFLIHHPEHGRYMFDLGIRKHGEGYPPACHESIKEFSATCNDSSAEQLSRGDVDPATVKGVIFSHLHWDHTGDITTFPSAEIILGKESKPLLDKPYPHFKEAFFAEWPAGRTATYLDFSESAANPPPTGFPRPIPRRVAPLGPFAQALDFFGDGSLYILDTPGHLPGHLTVLARVANTPGNAFILLAADTCHNRECYKTGHRLISELNYLDLEVARESVRKLAQVNSDAKEVLVMLAHEKEFEHEMPFFPNELGGWVVEEVAKKSKV
ncbi:hypothetical protein JAAARDRAFT_159624, partial [Jaapia argillacea MUCL 33604]